MRKNIVTTGRAGFIGSRVVPEFINKYADYQITNLDALTYAGNLKNLKDIEDAPNYSFVKADITEVAHLAEIFNKYRPDWVIYLTAEPHVDRSITEPFAFVMTNVIGAVYLLDAVKEIWKDNNEGKSLKNTIVVRTKDALLFVQKEKSQDVKKIYNTLEKHQSKLID